MFLTFSRMVLLTIKSVRTAGIAAAAFLTLAACVSTAPTASLDGIKSASARVILWKKGQVGVLPSALANTVKACWTGDPLLDGFKAGGPVQRGNGVIAMRLDGPLAGDPPQRFIVVMTPAEASKPGYRVDMEYPVGSNYEFVRARLAKDVKTLEEGSKPCG